MEVLIAAQAHGWRPHQWVAGVLQAAATAIQRKLTPTRAHSNGLEVQHQSVSCSDCCWLVRSGRKSSLTVGPSRKKLSQVCPMGAMMRYLPLTRMSTFRIPSGRRTSKGRRTAWVRLLTKTVPMEMTISPDERI